MSGDAEFIVADWPAPARVWALTTTRTGGASRGAYASFNLGEHVGDDPQAVQHNRARLRTALALPADPRWLKQVHGVDVVNAAHATVGVEADGAWTDRSGVVCAVLTADCLPIFLCDTRATKVALLHAGWRGLARGIVESGVRALNAPAHELLAWLGPAIGPDAYEIGEDMRRAFVQADAGDAEAFRPAGPGRWRADLYALARRRLYRSGVHAVTGGERCTLRERERFYSYRRDGVTGRMASLIWLAQ
jgi:YfiH family protein